MKQIVTPFGTFLTGDLVAEAVHRYSLALSWTYECDFVDIPYLDAQDRLRRVQLRVGWLVDLDVVPALSRGAEVVEETTVTDILKQAAWVERHPALRSAPANDLTYGESSV
ncbi:hypothetical protein [Microbacterium phyllosphaerae]|uniref:hypothetical protein n=1 Tax=Microbacterium phyllosphaerae TaxID=124798 RepID=UPI000EA33D75|nr:hypothetical protein [Microbacterium phyllosphaerae]